MSKKIQIDIEVNGKMTKATVDAKKLRGQLDGLDDAQKKTTKSGDKFQKGLKGVGEQSANASKNFSKFSMGMGGFVGVYASLAAQLFAVSAAFQFLKRAGDLEALKAGQIAYASSTGTALRTLARDIQAATASQVAFVDASQAAAIGTAAGLSTDQLTRLGKAAADASQILGRDVTDSFNRLVRGVTKAEPELLDELGIILRLKDATEEYATAIGKTPEQLTQFEKSQAVANNVLGQAEEKYSAILDVVGRTPNQFAQLGIAFEEILDSIKEVVAVMAGPFATALKDTPLIAASAFGLLLSGPMKAMGFSLKDIADEASESSKVQQASIEKLKKKRMEMVDVVGAQKKKLQELAKVEVKEGTTSKILKTLGDGGKLYGVDKANLKRALTAAENQFREHGEITSGIFKGRDAEVLASFRNTLNKMDNATQQTASKWSLAMNYMKTQALGFVAFTKNAFAGLVTRIGKLFSIAGWASIIALGYQSAVAAMKKYGMLAEEAAPSFDAQQVAAEGLRERIRNLSEEYEKFAEVLAVKIVYAGNSFEVLYSNAGDLANMLATTFSSDNIDTMFDQLAGDYTTELYKIEMTNKKFISAVGNLGNHPVWASLKATVATPIIGVGGVLSSLLTMDPSRFMQTMDLVNGKFSELDKIVVKGAMNLSNYFFGTEYTFKISDTSTATFKNINESLDSINVFQEKMREEGLEGYTSFEDMGKALSRLKELAKDGIQFEEMKEFTELRDTIKETSETTTKLAGELKMFPELAKATAQAFSSVDQTLKGATQGDALRNAADAQLASMNEIIKGRGKGAKLTKDELDLINKLLKQRQLGERIAVRDFDRKTRALQLQQASLLNEDKLFKGTITQLKHQDKIRKSQETLKQAEEDRLILQQTYTAEELKTTPELVRQMQVIQATEDLENKRLGILKEQADFLALTTPIQNAIELNKHQQTLISGRKALVDMSQKEFNIRKQIVDIERRMARDKSAEAVADAGSANLFLDTGRLSASENLRLAKEERDIGLIANQKEYENKLAQIEIEYQLLDAKKEQTALEFELLALQLREKGRGDEAVKAEQLAAKTRSFSYGKAQEAAEQLALKAKEAADYGLGKAVRDAERAYRSLQRVNQVLKSAADAFKTAMNDSINAIFDSLSDKTLDLNEKLKEIGRNFLQAIQEAVTDKFIVEPILDMLGLGELGSSPTNPMYVQPVGSIVTSGSSTGGSTGGAAKALGSILGGVGQPGHSRENPLYVCCVCAEQEQTTKDDIINKVLNKDKDKKKAPGDEDKKGFFEYLFGKKMGSVTRAEAGKDGVEAERKSVTNVGGIFGQFVNDVRGLFSGDAPFLQSLGNIFSSGVEGFGSLFGDLFGNLGSLFGNLGGLFGGGGGAGGGLLSGLASMIPGIGPILGGAMSIFGFKNGGIMNNGSKVSGYATGGIADGPNSGHLAMLHGREAVVPLPNGNSIPVQMNGNGGMQNNNVTVNVSTDGQVQSSANGAMGENLGQVIAAAVQKELHNQKRAGGILNKHGAA